MGLTDGVGNSLRELCKQFEGLQEQVNALQVENASLRQSQCQLNLASASPRMQCSPPSESDKAFCTIPGEPDIPVIHLPGVPTFGETHSDRDYMECTSRRSSVKRVDPELVNKLFRDGGMIKGRLSQLEEAAGVKTADTSERPTINLADQKLNLLVMDPMYDEDTFNKHTMTFREFLAALSGKKHGGNFIERIASSLIFHGFAMAAILANSAYLGVAAHLDLQDSYRRVVGLTPHGPLHVVDYIFVSWFTLEIIIRIAAHKREFVFGDDWRWNLFDCCLVFESLVSLLTPSMANISSLRILRVFRMVRIVRLVRQVNALKKLRTMVFAFINTFFDLMWAILVIFVIIFVFSVFFANTVSSYFQGVNPGNAAQVAEAEAVNEDFGGIIVMMLSLWAAVSGGNDWMMYAEKIGFCGIISKYFFIFYIAFCATGMWNVVTGVFVDSAVCSRTEDEVVQGYLDEYKHTISQMRNFFAEVDEAGKGVIEHSQFMSCLKNPTVKAFMSGMDIDPEEGSIIFAILDADKNGSS